MIGNLWQTTHFSQGGGRREMYDAMNCSCNEPEELTLAEQWPNILVATVLILLSGVFSGLNLGLMSLTEDDLKVLSFSGD